MESSYFVPPSSQHPPLAHGRVGLLLINLGTPEATTYWPMWRYLREFLSDRRVIETPRLLWWPLLYGPILLRRPFRSGEAYRRIWNKERDESPLRSFTRAQAEALAARFQEEITEPQIEIAWAMRYGTPSIPEKIRALQERGCDRLLIFPLYPQYAASTTATVQDVVFRTFLKMRWQPSLRFVPPYYADPVYIEALASCVLQAFEGCSREPELVLASFHGIPLSYFRKGDPYYCHCAKTVRLLRERLGWPEKRLRLVFQSRFGPEEWLKPYTDVTIRQMAQEGVKRLAVITPGFVADCLETIDEIGRENAELFRAYGGEEFLFIPCLNASPTGITVLEHVVRRELRGWCF